VQSENWSWKLIVAFSVADTESYALLEEFCMAFLPLRVISPVHVLVWDTQCLAQERLIKNYDQKSCHDHRQPMMSAMT